MTFLPHVPSRRLLPPYFTSFFTTAINCSALNGFPIHPVAAALRPWLPAVTAMKPPASVASGAHAISPAYSGAQTIRAWGEGRLSTREPKSPPRTSATHAEPVPNEKA